ncbi:MAG: methionine adenosyltransferase [Rothia mucilaginosa]|uniref:methionine adenosyltransferase n=1 Tax=Rothia TaxID=32207 RepID=UPI00066C5C98|nr:MULTISPECIES: methionine adenosyltransferase [Rothia]MBF1642186.1 methionine adenosyltransferase [Rothia mucilaginosa]MBF1665925.1 methionine adenosyltransferase [Rothia sp. (in: high G+C Gram-positive bacteria)]MBF1668519.1 methionine adenosyltransferase [Rothia sp. (in: high G+C Gram-positive bacteria)]MBF1670238.1 methionine adenosyltransferase [Rothia mucilaginosa]MBF1671955.1 methionine adenosyltransferase [Rothia mucilaginosa]
MSNNHLRLFTSESVTEGHPDKICDQISDAILDGIIAQDPAANVAVETMVTTGQVHVAGEVTTSSYVEIPSIVRETILGIGYDSSTRGFDGEFCGVSVSIGEQSPDINAGVYESLEVRQGIAADEYDRQGAGDQGIMFGYASNETNVLMPAPIWLAHRLSERLTKVRKDGLLTELRPDGKTQVTLGYDSNNVPVSVDTVVVSSQHTASYDLADLRADIEKHVIAPVLGSVELDSSNAKFIVNPAGRFVQGGPVGDAGLTGRKIIVDTYGGSARHGGGAFSGKDPSKVDRSAAYAMRWVAKNIVGAGLADRAEVQVAYAIGQAAPVGLYVETFGTEKVDPIKIEKAVHEVFDLRPLAIINELDLRRPIYKKTAAHGHFGRTEPEFTWERLNRVDALRSAVSSS